MFCRQSAAITRDRTSLFRVVTDTPALIAAAAGVGFGHAILPDHWVPLAVVGRTRRYPLSKVARLSGLAGVAHVMVSLVLGAVIVIVGLQLRDRIESAQNTIIGLILIATGVGFLVMELSGHGHGHATTTTTTTTTTMLTITATCTTPRAVARTRSWESWSRSAPPRRRI